MSCFNKLELFIFKKDYNSKNVHHTLMLKTLSFQFADHATIQPLSMNAQARLSVFLIRENSDANA